MVGPVVSVPIAVRFLDSSLDSEAVAIKFLISAGPSGREVISLQKVDSQLRLVNAGEAKKLSARLHHRDLDVFWRFALCSSPERKS
jgi:hypothetical protein